MGELALWRTSAAFGNWREYEAVLPRIIGYVPKGERKFFSNVVRLNSPWYVYFIPPLTGEEVVNQNKLNLLREKMGGTLRLVEEDIALIDDPNLNMKVMSIKKLFAEAGSIIGPTPHPHIEPPVYLISDKSATNFYVGRTRARYRGLTEGDLDEESAGSLLVVSAPPWSIVRIEPWTVHASLTVAVDTERTQMAIMTTHGNWYNSKLHFKAKMW
jgi:hypothetical protein